MNYNFRYSKDPHPHYPIVYPKPYSSAKKVKGYWIRDPPSGTFTNPDIGHMSTSGWIQVFCCTLFCWPCFFLPCLFSMNYDGYQVPDYEN